MVVDTVPDLDTNHTGGSGPYCGLPYSMEMIEKAKQWIRALLSPKKGKKQVVPKNVYGAVVTIYLHGDKICTLEPKVPENSRKRAEKLILGIVMKNLKVVVDKTHKIK